MMPAAQWIALAVVFVLGAAIGSLLNVCIYRLPRADGFWHALRRLVYPPSHCPGCQQPIAFRDNVPILGWLLLTGRCRMCRASISIRYPLIELLTACLFAGVYWFEVRNWWQVEDSSLYHALGPAGSIWSVWLSPAAVQHWRFAAHAILIAALITVTMIDMDLGWIPDTVTLPGMAAGVLANGIIGQVYFVPFWYQTADMAASAGRHAALFEALRPQDLLQDWLGTWLAVRGIPDWIAAHPHLHGLAVSLAGMIAGGGIVWIVRAVGQWALKREAMGFGDVLLLAMIGSFLGWQAVLLIFWLALVVAVAVAVPFRTSQAGEFPFGPYLAVGTLLVLVAGRMLWPTYEIQVLALGPLLVPMALVMGASTIVLLVAVRALKNLSPAFDPPQPNS
jgi:leader peptidase (prepilin peptidase)/N-methyltransferase